MSLAHIGAAGNPPVAPGNPETPPSEVRGHPPARARMRSQLAMTTPVVPGPATRNMRTTSRQSPGIRVCQEHTDGPRCLNRIDMYS